MAERRRVDVLALLVGVLALGLSGLALASRAGVLPVDGLVALGAVCVLLGLAGIGRAVVRLVLPGEGQDEGGSSAMG